MRLIFFGSPEFAQPSLERVAGEPGVEVSLVVSQPDRKVGRSRAVTSPPVAELARRLGIPLLQPEAIRDPAFLERIRGESPDVFAVVAYGRILPPALLAVPRFGGVNLHASLLPRHRGASPVQAALLAGDPVTGVATMRMTAGLDEGPVYLHRHVRILPDDDAGSLSRRLSREGADLLAETLRGISTASLEALPQEGEPSYCRTLRRTDGEVDWSRTADEILRASRALSPWPGLFTYRNGERIKILGARAGPESRGRAPGDLFESGGSVAVVCGSESSIVPVRLQREGKRPASAEEFFRGLPPEGRFGR
ncbi:MAG: methionyl-tRNA formyltransferase [Thermoanaerobaculia bacterium]